MATRKFDGKEYRSFAKTKKKSNALETAKRLRSRGGKVRVVPTSDNMYHIYTRRSK